MLIGNQRRAKTRCRIGFSFLAAQFSLGRRFKFPRYLHGPTKNIWQFVKTRRRFGNWRQERSCGSVDGQRRTFQHRHSWKFTRCSRSRLKNVWNRPSRRLSRFARPRVTQNSDVLSNRRPRPRPRHVTLIPIHFNRELDLWITTASIFSLVQRYRRRLLLISLQSIGAAPRFASFATVPASLELFSRARCTQADRSSRQNEYVNRIITFANFKYLITRSLSFGSRISQDSSLLAFLQWKIYENNRTSHWKYIVWKECQRSSRCRILRSTAVTSLIPNEPIPVVWFAQSVRLPKRDTDTFRSVLTSVSPRYCYLESLPTAVPRSCNCLHSAAVPCWLVHPLYSPMTPSSSTVDWNRGWTVAKSVIDRENKKIEMNRNEGERDEDKVEKRTTTFVRFVICISLSISE